MSERITRKELRTDRFAVAVEHNVEYVAEHRKQIVRYGIVAAAAIALGAGIYYYRGQQQTVRQDHLAEGIQIQESAVTPGATPGHATYRTEDERRTAASKAFTSVATQHSGTREGWIAEYYLACIAADAGKLDEGRKRFQLVADSGDKDYASLARFSLADIDFVENRGAEGEKILRDLMEHPTVMVSKDQATIALARHIAVSNPAAAKKLVEPMLKGESAASRIAVQFLGELK